ncbi:MAG: hypothetical protein NDJ90_13885 [Oligoflexia bacterium]|nr:hypothetical protein [Oligoflexia bacterium]
MNLRFSNKTIRFRIDAKELSLLRSGAGSLRDELSLPGGKSFSYGIERTSEVAAGKLQLLSEAACFILKVNPEDLTKLNEMNPSWSIELDTGATPLPVLLELDLFSVKRKKP